MGFASISTDLYLPAMPAMGRALSADAGTVEMTVSGYLIGFSVGQLLWGPIAGYFAKQHGDELKVTPLLAEPKNTRMEFYITMAVRPGENQWKNDINDLIRTNKDAIEKILRDYNIPLLNARGELVQ